MNVKIFIGREKENTSTYNKSVGFMIDNNDFKYKWSIIIF